MSLRKEKCSNCGKLDTLNVQQTGDCHWVRCRRCGFHTSSYTTLEAAKQAAKGRLYLSENENVLSD